jgi:hypothetical protein
MVRKDKNGQIDYGLLWAQHIYRTEKAGKDYIFALVRRKFGTNDVETRGPGEYIGIKEETIYQKTTDTNPDSPTFNQRIDEELSVFDGAGREQKQKIALGKNWEHTDEANDKTLENYKKLVGNMPKPLGDTKFYWILPEGKYDATSMKEFFETDIADVRVGLFEPKTLKSRKSKGKRSEEDASE